VKAVKEITIIKHVHAYATRKQSKVRHHGNKSKARHHGNELAELVFSLEFSSSMTKLMA
jgi:hypothetical protein